MHPQAIRRTTGPRCIHARSMAGRGATGQDGYKGMREGNSRLTSCGVSESYSSSGVHITSAAIRLRPRHAPVTPVPPIRLHPRVASPVI